MANRKLKSFKNEIVDFVCACLSDCVTLSCVLFFFFLLFCTIHVSTAVRQCLFVTLTIVSSRNSLQSLSFSYLAPHAFPFSSCVRRYAPTAAVALITERDQLAQRVHELAEETAMLRTQVQIKQEQFDTLKQKFQARSNASGDKSSARSMFFPQMPVFVCAAKVSLT